jgi:2-dehydro-3-deoxygalactonokinase
VACSQALALSGALFQVRARQVLQHVPPAANLWFLSGILVGDEVRTLAVPGRPRLHLIGEPARVALYRRALGSVDPGRGKDTLHDVSLTAAIVAGQEQLLTRHAGGLTP